MSSKLFFPCILALILISGCAQKSKLKVLPRESAIPENATKVTPETDLFPPILHSEEYEEPVPMPYPINTKGVEDSPFISPDGNTLYIWFTPDPSIPAQLQLIDGVTGYYVSHKEAGQWTEPERMILNDGLSLDGCLFAQGNKVWFCSVRAGNYREIDFWTAEYVDGEWSNWKNLGERLNVEIGVGELHVTSDGNAIYYHSDISGNRDIYVTRKVNGEWQDPEPVSEVNTELSDSLPFVTEDMQELWFTRQYKGSPAIFRSKLINSSWSEPELIVSQFATEPTLDNEGNIYFVHHFFKDGKMLEADYYVAYKK